MVSAKGESHKLYYAQVRFVKFNKFLLKVSKTGIFIDENVLSKV